MTTRLIPTSGLVAVLLAAPVAVQAQFTYTTTNGAITITGYSGSGGNVTIPGTINGLPVAGIGPYAFLNNNSLTNVAIPDSVISIGDSAFDRCSSLTSVTIPDSVISIGDSAFGDCSSLPSVTIPDSVTSVGDSAFTLCLSLSSVTIPDSVSSIGDGAFWGCPSLTNVTVAAQNPAYSSLNGVLFDKRQTTLIRYPTGNAATNYTIPNSVINIGDGAFESCGVTSVTIPSSVTSIGGSAFARSSLTSVTIPSSVTSIGDEAFLLSGLTSVTIGNGVTNIGYEAFGCWILSGVFFTGNAPSGVDPDAFNISIALDFEDRYDPATVYYLSNTSGWSNAFAGLPTLMLDGPPQLSTTDDGWKYLSDQVTVAIITGYAGSNQAVVIPSIINGLPVTAVWPCVFYYNTSLTSVTIPNSVTSIGYSAFAGCSSLTSVTIPDSVTSIGDSAFWGCLSLTSVYFGGDAPTADSSVFAPDDHATVYYLPGTTGWSNTFAGTATALWMLPQPLILNQGPAFGVQSNQFGFTISWATNVPVVVEACTNLANPAWLPVSTNTLVGGTSYFRDPQPANLPGRFYRLKQQ